MTESLFHLIAQNKPFAIAGGLLLLSTFYKVIKQKIQFRGKALAKTGLGEAGTPPKGYINNECLCLTEYSLEKAHEAINETSKIKSQLEVIYHKKITKIEIVQLTGFKKYFMKSPLIFWFENLPNYIDIKEKPKGIEYPEIWMGKDSQGKDLIENVENAHGILVLSRAGGGKSIFARVIINQFKHHEKVVIDDKGNDYHDIVDGKNFYNPSSQEELIKAVEKLEKYIERCENFKLKLKANKIQVNHWNEIETEEKPSPMLIICDEFSQYFTLNKKNLNKEQEEYRERLLKCIVKILSLYRVSGSVVCCLTQDANQSSTDLPFVNFPIRLFSRQNQQMSVQLIGTTELNDNNLIKGLFYIISPNNQGKIRTPLYPLPEQKATKGRRIDLSILTAKEEEADRQERAQRHIDNKDECEREQQ